MQTRGSKSKANHMSVSPPRPKGPPLNALRAFEAAARLGGFASAADELCVTAGAITQQIKSLEAWIGAPLFERHAQGVQLTNAGAEVAADFTAAFDDLGRAVQRMRSTAPVRVVQIATLPSIAQLWLSPRLPSIRRAYPDLTFSVTALETPPNLLRAGFDLGIFYSDAAASETHIRLQRDEIFPVCAPEVAAGLSKPTDLNDAVLIGDATWAQDWEAWLGTQGGGRSGPSYSLYSLAVEEAVQGAGVLIGHKALVAAHLAAGTLQAPFDARLKLDQHLALMLPRAPQSGGIMQGLCQMLSRP